MLLAPQDDLVKRVAPDAEKAKKTAKKLAPAAKDKVEKALGEKLDAADLARFAPRREIRLADVTAFFGIAVGTASWRTFWAVHAGLVE